MRLSRLVFLAALLALMATVSVQGGVPASPPDVTTELSKLHGRGWLNLQTAVGDVDGDKVKEQVVVRVSGPEREPGGEIAWDDSHLWRVSVYDSGKEKVVYEEYLSMAAVFVSVGTTTGKKTPSIVVIMDQPDDLAVMEFTWNSRAYTRKDVLWVLKPEPAPTLPQHQ